MKFSFGILASVDVRHILSVKLTQTKKMYQFPYKDNRLNAPNLQREETKQ